MTDRELLDQWFITEARRGKPLQATVGNDVTPYVHYVDYYAAVGDAMRAASGGGVVLLAGWGLDLATKVGTPPLQQPIGELLKQVGSGGSKVRVLLSGHFQNPSSGAVDWIRRQPGCAAVLDDRTRLPGCFHQKSVAVLAGDGVMAFAGGMDISADRLADPDSKRAPWHDVQVRVRGPGAADLYATLAARWESHRSNARDRLPRAPAGGGARRTSGRAVQVVRTYGNPRTGIPLTVLRPENSRLSVLNTWRQLTEQSEFSFAPTGESAIHDLLVKAIRATRETIYVEDQYFVASAGIGGSEELLQALAEAIARPTFKHMLVLTTGVGTVQGELHQVNRRRRDLVRRIAGRFPDRISLWAYKGGQDRCYWLHSKTWLFDDTMAVIGSANFNRRGLSHDGELAVGVIDLEDPGGGWVHQLRTTLWLKHLPSKTRPVTLEQVMDFEKGRALWVDTADTLLFRMDPEAGEPTQPDHLMVCDDPPPPSWLGRFFRACACGAYPFTGPLLSYDTQWNVALDPDGS